MNHDDWSDDELDRPVYVVPMKLLLWGVLGWALIILMVVLVVGCSRPEQVDEPPVPTRVEPMGPTGPTFV